MSKIFGNVIKATKGEDIPFAVPVYENGQLANDMVSATFSYVGADMVEPVEDVATVEQGSVISYVLSHDVTATLTAGLYTYCIKSINDAGLERVSLKGYIIVEDDIFVVPMEEPS